MTVETLKKRIEGKEKEIKKLESKLSRIEKAKASNWENNPYYYNERDMIQTARDLESAKKALLDYKDALIKAEEKANSRNVEAIIKFLEIWQRNCFNYYNSGIKEYYEEYENVRKLYESNDPGYEEADKVLNERRHGKYEKRTYFDPYFKRLRTEKVKVEDGYYERFEPFINYPSWYGMEEGIEKIKRDFKHEADAKYDDIINRTNKVVGEITDATGLSVGDKGDLNGIIIGTRGKARVETIGAGGWNIQCFHFRTLIHELK